MNDTNKERAEFEAHYFAENGNRLYCESQWRGWKAHASLAAKAPAAPTAAEPVAWRYQTPTGWHATTDARAAMRVSSHHLVEPLYTAPPAPTEQWMPIETAPRDGTEVLLWREDCGQFIGRYTSCDAFPLTQDEIDATDEETLFAKDWFTQWPQALRLEGSEVPTRWRHLPDDPAPPQGAAKGTAA